MIFFDETALILVLKAYRVDESKLFLMFLRPLYAVLVQIIYRNVL